MWRGCLRMAAALVCACLTSSGSWRPVLAFRTRSAPEPLGVLRGTHQPPSSPTTELHNLRSIGATEDGLKGAVESENAVSEGGNGGGDATAVAEPPSPVVQDLELCDEISDSFMKYALSIILGRALPDARDGLKVVHRRILWAMQDLKLGASTPYRKCAKVVGDVLGKYHPHSDKSVYDALCRLSQRFMMRVPLVDGHGNFGSADDPPAAMRYTECRLSLFSEKLLLPDVGRETVDMLPNFDSTELEPTVLPSKVPMLLINGSSGIAVGLATSIPPHNPDEIISAAMFMARNHGEVDPEALLHIVRGPDFPTGGHISTTMENLRKIYMTGKGSVMLQAKFSYEERIKPRNSKRESDVVVNTYSRPSQLTFSAGSRASIIVTELPYNVRLRDVMLSISKGVETGSLRGIADLRDESDRSGIRLVIDLKRHITTQIEVEEIMSKLKRMNGLCTFFKCNFIALDSSGTKPVRLTLHTALRIWLDFRVQTVRKRTQYLLRHAQDRLNIVKGFVVASKHIDDIVRMIRSSASPAEARKSLTDKRFGALNAEQANAVMRMTLSQLSKMEREKFENEERELTETIENYNKLLNDDRNIYAAICAELHEIQQQRRKHYSSKRRCTSLSVAGQVKKFMVDVLPEETTPLSTASDVSFGASGVGDDAESEEEQGCESSNSDDEDSEEESEVEDGQPRYKDPSLIVVNNLGWVQRIKLDNMFFTSGRARSIYSPRVYQAQVGQYSINSEQAEAEAPKEPVQEKILLHYGLCRPEDTALLIGQDGVCLSFPVSKLRLCKRGYSMWKALELDRTERIAHLAVTRKLLHVDGAGADEKRKRMRVVLENSEDYLVVGFSDGQVSIMRAGILETTRLNKMGIARVRLWSDQRAAPVFAVLAGSRDDIFVATAQGHSVRVRLEGLVSGMGSRHRTTLRVIRLREGDAVTCGALLEGPFDDAVPENELPSDEPGVEGDEQGGLKKEARAEGRGSWSQESTDEPTPTGRHLMLLSQRGKGKLIPISELKVRHQGGTGYDIMRRSERTEDYLVSAVPVEPEDYILLVSEQGLLARKDPFVLRPGRRQHKMRNFWQRVNQDDVLKYAVKI
ncbi:DNA gyrase subunit A [Babesia caballi]|uniref:DNA topoisomerase (ATP-hydrolyzing) n=1 Tax=Babesia caballi TaxID=5871 RepID=A0AAV4M6A1_BABCB|nr:DNA gyrase subunit A [Babesia caballi]